LSKGKTFNKMVLVSFDSAIGIKLIAQDTKTSLLVIFFILQILQRHNSQK
jgi:hypothetical protein